MRRSYITLTTDYGLRDESVGLMKLGIRGVTDAEIIDINHKVGAYNIKDGAWNLWAALGYAPGGGNHVCVVDPGVGTERRRLIIQMENQYGGQNLVGPDNGVLMPATRRGTMKRVVSVENPKYMAPQISDIFEGRDVFGPVAGHLANRVPLDVFGPEVAQQDLVAAPYSDAHEEDGRINGEVIRIDTFGNMFTNVPIGVFRRSYPIGSSGVVRFGDFFSYEFQSGRTFSDVTEGKRVAMDDSYGYLHFGVNQGSAAEGLFNRGGLEPDESDKQFTIEVRK